MIKIGCAAYSYRDYLKDGRMKYEDFIEEAYRIGLDGVELTLYWLPSKEKSYLRTLKRLSAIRGLPISCVGISTNFCDPNPSEREKNVKAVKEGIEIARELGAPCLRVFGGYVSEGVHVDDAMKWVVESIKSCVNYAEENGVIIAIENHGGITSRASDVIKIVEEVNSQWFKVNLDLGNYREPLYEEISKTIPYAVHIHAKVSAHLDKGKREVIDYEWIKKALLSKGYNGFLSIEYEEEEDPKIGVPRFARHLFNIFCG
ncbi:MAG: sugar phosphate isomerase/epimerase [Candidatus Bathyarchaeota archaeon]|nr:sugar phosphate isomerase/epimerase [Candidatus Bathyarchaeota archaeon]